MASLEREGLLVLQDQRVPLGLLDYLVALGLQGGVYQELRGIWDHLARQAMWGNQGLAFKAQRVREAYQDLQVNEGTKERDILAHRGHQGKRDPWASLGQREEVYQDQRETGVPQACLGFRGQQALGRWAPRDPWVL